MVELYTQESSYTQSTLTVGRSAEAGTANRKFLELVFEVG